MIRRLIPVTTIILGCAIASPGNHDPTHVHSHDPTHIHSEDPTHVHSHEHEHRELSQDQHEHAHDLLDHDHDHHGHDCAHSHGLASTETNVHKLLAIKIGELTGFCCLMEYLDQVMRPLPFLA
jgi:hypothetical protein